MRHLRLPLVTALSVLFATVLAALPWGLPAELRQVPPLLPFLVLHYWTMRDARLMPEILVFAAGIALDIATGGPAGYWSLIYLAGYALTLGASMTVLASDALSRWLLLGVTLLALSLVEIALATIYFATAANWSTPLVAALVATMIYPLVAAPLRVFAGPRTAATARDPSWGRAT